MADIVSVMRYFFISTCVKNEFVDLIFLHMFAVQFIGLYWRGKDCKKHLERIIERLYTNHLVNKTIQSQVGCYIYGYITDTDDSTFY